MKQRTLKPMKHYKLRLRLMGMIQRKKQTPLFSIIKSKDYLIRNIKYIDYRLIGTQPFGSGKFDNSLQVEIDVDTLNLWENALVRIPIRPHFGSHIHKQGRGGVLMFAYFSYSGLVFWVCAKPAYGSLEHSLN